MDGDWQALIRDPAWLAAGAALLLALLGGWFWRRRRLARRPEARLRAAAADSLHRVLIPDGDGGEIHIEHALLTPGGILIVDLRQVSGHVFGSNAMQDWTVIDHGQRYTFANPQPGLYDRLAAVRRLLPGVPVSGRVVFTGDAKFGKGLPDDVTLLDALLSELAEPAPTLSAEMRAALDDGWNSLRQAAVEAQLGQLLRD
ncbi:MAG: NERD domain-containing protein [Gammaproteobacteria bacterium]|nr:MAG: NERD domain-containing protein [Gammaproteobacteria bacterium]